MPFKFGFPAIVAGRAAAAPRPAGCAGAAAPARPWPAAPPAGGVPRPACPARGITVSDTAAATAIATIAPVNRFRMCQVSCSLTCLKLASGFVAERVRRVRLQPDRVTRSKSLQTGRLPNSSTSCQETAIPLRPLSPARHRSAIDVCRKLGAHDGCSGRKRAHFTPRGLATAWHEPAIGAREEPRSRHMCQRAADPRRDHLRCLDVFGAYIDHAEQHLFVYKLTQNRNVHARSSALDRDLIDAAA